MCMSLGGVSTKMLLGMLCAFASMPASAQRIVKISSATEAVTPRERLNAAQVYEACKVSGATSIQNNACFEREFRRRSMVQFVLMVR